MLRNALAFLPVVALGMLIAANIDTETSTFSILLLSSLVVSLLFGVLLKYARFEAVVLGLLLIGYLVGNRGFAQLAVVQPFFVGEMGLAALIICQMVRAATKHKTVRVRNVLGGLIFVYFVAAMIRFAFDVSVYQLDAARDLALVYYSLFFFVAYQLGTQEESRQFLENCLAFAFVGLGVVMAILTVFPDIGSDGDGDSSVLALYQKGDLLGAFAVTGLFFVYIRTSVWGWKLIRTLLISIFSVTVILGVARSAIMALLIGSILFWVAGFRRFFIELGIAVLGAIVIALFSFAAVNEGSQSEILLGLKEKLVSIVDFTGQYNYQSDLGLMKASNNEFRRVFWDSIIKETNDDNPLFGKGFGYNFLTRFEQSFNRGHWEGLRSAHNYYITVYGRMGIVGILIFGAITIQIIRGGLKAAVQVQQGLLDQRVLVYWCCAWVVLVSSCVGVVLEGPMGAIVFWSFLGLAVSGSDVADEKQPRSVLDRHPRNSAQAGITFEPVSTLHRQA